MLGQNVHQKQITGFFKLQHLKNYLRYNVRLHVVRYPWKFQLNLVIFAGFGQACQGMSKVLQNNKTTASQVRIEFFFFFLHVVTHPWKLQFYHVVLVGYDTACLKFFEATSHQYLWKRSCDFIDFLQVVICILLVIH